MGLRELVLLEERELESPDWSRVEDVVEEDVERLFNLLLLLCVSSNGVDTAIVEGTARCFREPGAEVARSLVGDTDNASKSSARSSIFAGTGCALDGLKGTRPCRCS